jgi:hypothetical protein
MLLLLGKFKHLFVIVLFCTVQLLLQPNYLLSELVDVVGQGGRSVPILDVVVHISRRRRL